jgi:hypothetical protein
VPAIHQPRRLNKEAVWRSHAMPPRCPPAPSCAPSRESPCETPVLAKKSGKTPSSSSDYYYHYYHYHYYHYHYYHHQKKVRHPRPAKQGTETTPAGRSAHDIQGGKLVILPDDPAAGFRMRSDDQMREAANAAFERRGVALPPSVRTRRRWALVACPVRARCALMLAGASPLRGACVCWPRNN